MAETLLQKAQRLGIQPESEPEKKPAVRPLGVDTGISRGVETLGDVKETFLGIGQQLFKSGEQIVETATERELTLGEKIRDIGSEAFRGGSRAFGEAVIGVGKAALPQEAEEAIARGAVKVGKRVAETETVQGLVERYNSLGPETKREVDNALGFAEGLSEIISFGTLGRLKRPVLRALEETIERVSKSSKISTKTVQLTTPSRVRQLYGGLNPSERTSAIKTLSDTYQKSFVDDRPAISNKLEKEAKKQTKRGDLIDSTKLLTDLAEDTKNGVLPYVDGKLIKFDTVILNLEKRQDALAKGLDPFLATIPEQTPISNLKSAAEASLRSSRQIRGAGELTKSLKELDRFFDSLEEGFGDILSAQDLNEIRVGMNRRSRSFDKDVFKQDSAFAIADASRNRIDGLVPDGIANKVNAEWGRLEGIKRTADILHNQTINVGVLGGQLGRYLGVIGLSGAGLGVGGPGGLVVAGIAAHFGGEAVAQLLRNRRFGKRIKDEIIDTLRRDEALIKQLIEETKGADRALLERVLLPPPAETPIRLGAPVGESSVKAVPAPKGEKGAFISDVETSK